MVWKKAVMAYYVVQS